MSSPDGSSPPAPPAPRCLPPVLVGCEPYYERVRLLLRRFLAYLKPWEARSRSSAGASDIPPQPDHIDSFVVAALVGEGYADARVQSLRWLSEAIERLPLAALKGDCPTHASTRGDGPRAETVAGRFDTLREELALTAAEVDLFWLLLAPELLPELMWVYRAIWGDSGQVACPEDFLRHVLDPFGEAPRLTRAPLRPDGALRRLSLVEPLGRRSRPQPRAWRVPQRVVAHLLGAGTLDESVRPFCELRRHVGGVCPEPAVDPLLLPRLRSLLASELSEQRWADTETSKPVAALHIYGPAGVGKRTLCAWLGAELGRAVLCCDLAASAQAELPLPQLLRRMRREAYLCDALLVLHGCGDLGEQSQRPLLLALSGALADQREPVFLLAPDRLPALSRLPVREVAVPFPTPGAEQREGVWTTALERSPATPAAGVSTRELARKYNLAPAGILRAVAHACSQSLLAGQAPPVVTQSDLLRAATAQLSHELATVADRVEKTLDWEDLVLPDDCLETLHEVVRRYRHQARVFDEWGFREKFAYGTGISVLFSGPPGTGKTMTAGILARELDMELFRIDLSRVVSKWIGETEKNLARVFDEGKASHAIILFDEADSLFGRRGEVRSSVDRYSNLEVNYLLQRMENYEGISILTTNQQQSMDEAFMRRITFKLSFPFPDEETRELLWRSVIPNHVRVESRIRFDVLAEKFEFSGGHIKNAILRAAFLAAEADSTIGFKVLLKAAIDEARGLGRLLRVEEVEELQELYGDNLDDDPDAEDEFDEDGFDEDEFDEDEFDEDEFDDPDAEDELGEDGGR